MTKQTDTSAEAVEELIQGPIKKGILSEGLPRTNEDTEVGYQTVDLIRALAAERNEWEDRAERVECLLEAWVELAAHCSIEEGVCCCGEDMENHPNPMDCGHSPVDHCVYVASQLVEETRATLAQTDADAEHDMKEVIK